LSGFLGEKWSSVADRKIRIASMSKACGILMRLCLCALVSEIGFAQATPAPGPAPAAQAPSKSPMTLDQLRSMLEDFHEAEATRALTLEEAERQRAKLPPWFPKSVWDAVEQKMGSVDVAKVELPVYQRYFSSETADGLILLFSGPLGQQLADQMMPRRVAIAGTGAQGSKATQAYIDGITPADRGIATVRLNQLGPADRERAVDAVQVLNSSWKAMSDEIAKSYDEFMNNLVQSELAKHSRELAAAQQAYVRASSGQSEPHR
jgi:hypothetical protein